MWSKIVIAVGVLMILWAAWNQMALSQAKQQKQAVTQMQQQSPFGNMPMQAQFQGQVDTIWKQAERQAQTRIIVVGVFGLLMIGGGGALAFAGKGKNASMPGV